MKKTIKISTLSIQVHYEVCDGSYNPMIIKILQNKILNSMKEEQEWKKK